MLCRYLVDAVQRKPVQARGLDTRTTRKPCALRAAGDPARLLVWGRLMTDLTAASSAEEWQARAPRCSRIPGHDRGVLRPGVLAG
jgi:hypothetical protein